MGGGVGAFVHPDENLGADAGNFARLKAHAAAAVVFHPSNAMALGPVVLDHH
jgi:hypothetical protein